MAALATREEIDSRDKNVAWYKDDMASLDSSLRDFITQYTGLAPDEVVPHIISIRERAWKVWPYPCLGEFRFLEPSLAMTPECPQIIERLKAGERFLDLGCCFAQDIRYLVSQCVPAENLCGSDLRAEFIDLGYDLFRDKDTLKAKFLVADIFDASPAAPLNQPEISRNIDIIYAGSFFHLFDWDDQVQIAKRLVNILRPKAGSMILGRQQGNINPGPKEHSINAKGIMYRQNSESFTKLWEDVGKATNTEWEVRAELDQREGFGKKNMWHGGTEDLGIRRLRFTVVRK